MAESMFSRLARRVLGSAPPPQPPPRAPAAPLFAPVLRGDVTAPAQPAAMDRTPAAPAGDDGISNPNKPNSARIYRVRSALGGWLARDVTGQICITPALDPNTGLLAVVPDANTNFCFLIAPDMAPLRTQYDSGFSQSISGHLLRTGAEAVFLLRHPFGPAFLAAHVATADTPATVVFNHNTVDSAVALVFLAAEAAAVPAVAANAAGEIAALADRPHAATLLLAALRAGRLRPGLLEGFLRLLPSDELTLFARHIATQPADFTLVQQALPNDTWLHKDFADLVAWRTNRVAATHHLTSPVSDEDATLPVRSTPEMPVGLLLTSLLRADTAPRRNLCMLASARNEGVYLLDWIAYHRSIGFEHIFLYTNDNTDGSDTLLQALANAGEITLVQNKAGPHVGPQYKAYSQALTRLPQILDYRWTMILDIDEYFVFDTKRYRTAGDVIAFQETQDVDAIAYGWLLFGAGVDTNWTHAPTWRRFVNRQPGVNPHIKSMFRTNRFWGAQAHYPYATQAKPFIYRTEQGDLHHHHGVTDRIPAFATSPSADHAWINHYTLRTLPEALWKLARGQGDWTGKFDPRQAEFAPWLARTFFNLAETATEDDRRINACANGIADERERLMALPGVGDAEQALRRAWVGQLRNATAAFVGSAAEDGEIPEVTRLRMVAREHHTKPRT